MAWLQVKITATGEQAGDVEALLIKLDALSVTVTDAADQPLLEPDPQTHPIWDQVIVIGLFPAETKQTDIASALDEADIATESISYEPLEDRQWETVWMDQYHPMQFGERLWIYPSHIQPEDTENKTIIRLDPGLAFGSGTHPTTRLCLEWIDQIDMSGKTVVDYGCGSGILAIACALKGATSIYAIDHDDQALLAIYENAKLNGVGERITISQPEGADCQPVDILLANILAGPLTELAPTFVELTKPDGYIVLSGILNTQLTSLEIAYSKLTQLQGHASCEDWARLVVKTND